MCQRGKREGGEMRRKIHQKMWKEKEKENQREAEELLGNCLGDRKMGGQVCVGMCVCV